MLRREIPFLRIVPFVCLGIICGRYFEFSDATLIIVAVISSAGLILSIAFSRAPENYLHCIFNSMLLVICGYLLFSVERMSITTLTVDDSMFIAEVSDYPRERDNSWVVPAIIRYTIRGSDTAEAKAGMILYHRKDSFPRMLEPGDIMIVGCRPAVIENRGNPDEFNYRFYMEAHGTRYYSFTAQQNIIGWSRPLKKSIRSRALMVRQQIIRMYNERGIEGDRLALAAALMLGEKRMLDPGQREIFIKVGVMHIMAVSGLHAGILSYAFFSLLFFMKRRMNPLRVILTIIFLWCFAFVTGLTPSVLRATIMFSFLHAGNLMKRPVNSLNSVLASAFILLLINPYVLFDPGFLLSYSAVLFIILFYQNLYSKLSFRFRVSDFLWKSASLTIVAQAGTMAFSIMLFNRFPTWFLLSNLFIVPLSSVTIITGCLVPLFYPFEALSLLFARVFSWLIAATEFLTDKAASLPLSTIENIGLAPYEAILLMTATGLLIWSVIKSKPGSLRNSLIVILLFNILLTARTIDTKRTSEIIVFNTTGYTTVAFRSGKMLLLFCNNPELPSEVKRYCSVRGIKISGRYSASSDILMSYGSHIILISDSLVRGRTNDGRLDNVILTGKRPYLEEGIIESIPSLKEIIVSDGTINSARLAGLKDVTDVKIWQVRLSGAWRHEINQ